MNRVVGFILNLISFIFFNLMVLILEKKDLVIY